MQCTVLSVSSLISIPAGQNQFAAKKQNPMGCYGMVLSFKEKLTLKIKWHLKYSLGFSEDKAKRIAFWIYWMLSPRTALSKNRLKAKALKEDAVCALGLAKYFNADDCRENLYSELGNDSRWHVGTSKGLLRKKPEALDLDEKVVYLHHNSLFSLIPKDRFFEFVDHTFGPTLRAYYGANYRVLSAGIYITLPSAQTHRFSSQQWHMDGHPPGMIKGFIYLSDVHENDGPFTIILGSHRKKLERQADISLRFNEEFVLQLRHTVQTMLGPAGTSFLANTNAIHRGPPPRGEQRVVLNIFFLPSHVSPVEHFEKYGLLNSLEGPDRIHEPIWNHKVENCADDLA